MSHTCPWWGGYFIDNRLRRLIHNPSRIFAGLVTSGMTAMDFGCGMGLFSIAMARLVGPEGRVVAVDIQRKMLDVLAKRARKAGVGDRIETHQCEADTLGDIGPFDFALAFYSVHETSDRMRLLRDIADRLHSGGRFLIAEPVGHVRAKDFEDVELFSREAGFVVEDRPRIRFSRTLLLER